MLHLLVYKQQFFHVFDVILRKLPNYVVFTSADRNINHQHNSTSVVNVKVNVLALEI